MPKHQKRQQKKQKPQGKDYLSNPVLIQPFLFQLWSFLGGLPACPLTMVNQFWHHCFWPTVACLLPKNLQLGTEYILRFPRACAAQITQLDIYLSKIAPLLPNPQTFASFCNLQHLYLSYWVFDRCNLSLIPSAISIHIYRQYTMYMHFEDLPRSLIQLNEEDYDPTTTCGSHLSVSVQLCTQLKHLSFGSVRVFSVNGFLPTTLESLILPNCHTVNARTLTSFHLPNLKNLSIASSCLGRFCTPSLTELCMRQVSLYVGDNALVSPHRTTLPALKHVWVIDPHWEVDTKITWTNLQELTLDYHRFHRDSELSSFSHLNCLSSLRLLKNPHWAWQTTRWNVKCSLFPNSLENLVFIGCSLVWEANMSMLTCLKLLQLFECHLAFNTWLEDSLPKTLNRCYCVGDNRYYYVKEEEN